MKALFEHLIFREQIKKAIRSVPGGQAAITSLHGYRKARLLKAFKNPADVFTHHYQKNFWGHEESVSGSGSSLEYTENIRREIPLLIDSLKIKSILDAPCGDYNWFRLIERADDVHYTGADIVAELIEKNNRDFANATTRFVVMDLLADPLPEVDLWLCRDCLFHLPNREINRALDQFRQSKIRYLLTTTYRDCPQNTDIVMGDFRPINLLAAPFNLPPAQLLIDDWQEGWPVRHLALWDRSALV